MGTNYYLRQSPCSHCGHVPADLHIGKSSAGWNFGLRIYPKIDGEPDERLKAFGTVEICELDDWRSLFDRFPIFDEYDKRVSAADMIATITERSVTIRLEPIGRPKQPESVAVYDHAINCNWQDGVSECDCNKESVSEGSVSEQQRIPCYGNGCPATRTCAACKWATRG